MDRVRTPVENLVDAGAEPVFAFYLGNQADEKLTIDGVNSAHNQKTSREQLGEHQEFLLLAQLASRQAK